MLQTRGSPACQPTWASIFPSPCLGEHSGNREPCSLFPNLPDSLLEASLALRFFPAPPQADYDEVPVKGTAPGENGEEEAFPQGVTIRACVESEWGGRLPVATSSLWVWWRFPPPALCPPESLPGGSLLHPAAARDPEQPGSHGEAAGAGTGCTDLETGTS